MKLSDSVFALTALVPARKNNSDRVYLSIKDVSDGEIINFSCVSLFLEKECAVEFKGEGKDEKRECIVKKIILKKDFLSILVQNCHPVFTVYKDFYHQIRIFIFTRDLVDIIICICIIINTNIIITTIIQLLLLLL